MLASSKTSSYEHKGKYPISVDDSTSFMFLWIMLLKQS